jgi:hypothetical protein
MVPLVDTTKAAPYLTAGEVTDGQQLTIGPENTQLLQVFQARNPGEKPPTKVFVGFEELGKQGVMNNTSRKKLERAWGTNTVNWVGKKVQVIVAKQIIQGELQDVLYFVRAGEMAKSQEAKKR